MRPSTVPTGDDFVSISQEIIVFEVYIRKCRSHRPDRFSRVLDAVHVSATFRTSRVGMPHVVGCDKVLERIEIALVPDFFSKF